MTSEEWINNIPSEQYRKYAREAVNAALEKEREGRWEKVDKLIEYLTDIDGLPASLSTVKTILGYASRPTKAEKGGAV